MKRRVVVTGIGVLCACGKTREEFRAALRTGRSGIGQIDSSQIGDLRFQNGGVIHGFNACEHMDVKQADMIDRFAQLALVAAREAVRHSGVEWTPELRDTAAIVTGSCVGGQSTEDQGFYDVYKWASPAYTDDHSQTMANAGASTISLEYGITARCLRWRRRALHQHTLSGRR